MEYAQILPRLFVGSHPSNFEDVEKLRRESDITAILNLQTDEDMLSHGIPWEALEAHYRACGMLVCRVPVRDEVSALTEKLPECVRALDHLLEARHTVYLHCTAGAGRSPTVAAAYLHRCWGWDLEVATAYVRERRPSSPSVEAIQQANWNLTNYPATP